MDGKSLNPMSWLAGSTPHIPPPAPPPPPPQTIEQPDPEDILINRQKRKQAAAARNSGRASTILSDAMNRRDTLGG